MKNLISIGNTGEYFVAGELERHGFTAAVPISNTKDFDILAINRETGKRFAIQVKTTSLKKREWTLNEKCEQLKKNYVVYFFVILQDEDIPEYHIVPGRIVARKIAEDHQKWLKTPGKKGRRHNDNSIRKFYDLDNVYLNNWGCLK